MKIPLPSRPVFAIAFLSAAFLSAAAAAGPDPAEDHLFLLKPAGTAVDLVSFGPKDPGDWFWKAPRTNEWRRYVSGKTRVGQSRIAVVPFGSEISVSRVPFHLRLTDSEKRTLDGLFAGMDRKANASSILSGDLGEACTNAFKAVSLRDRDMRFVAADGATFALSAGFGMGSNLWFCSWSDLVDRWNGLPRDDRRKEFLAVYSLFCEGGSRWRSGDDPGTDAWKTRLEEYAGKNPAVWREFQFKNRYGKGIVVRYRLKDPSAPWTEKTGIDKGVDPLVAAIGNPVEGYWIEWQFKPVDEKGLSWENCRTYEMQIKGWNDPSEVIVQTGAAPFMEDPRLPLGADVVPPPLLEEMGREVLVEYDGADEPKPVRVRGDGPVPYAGLDRGRTVKEVVFAKTPWSDEQKIGLVDARPLCGGTAALQRSLKVYEWPRIDLRPSLTNTASQTKTNFTMRFTVVVGGGVLESGGNRFDTTREGLSWKGSATDLFPALSNVFTNAELTLRVEVSADGFQSVLETALVARAKSAAPISRHPVLPREDPPWPDRSRSPFAGNSMGLRLRHVFGENVSTVPSDIGNGKTYSSYEQSIWDILGGNGDADEWRKTEFGKFRDHLEKCKDCDNCRKFRGGSGYTKFENDRKAAGSNERLQRLAAIVSVYGLLGDKAGMRPAGRDKTRTELFEEAMKKYLVGGNGR